MVHCGVGHAFAVQILPSIRHPMPSRPAAGDDLGRHGLAFLRQVCFPQRVRRPAHRSLPRGRAELGLKERDDEPNLRRNVLRRRVDGVDVPVALPLRQHPNEVASGHLPSGMERRQERRDRRGGARGPSAQLFKQPALRIQGERASAELGPPEELKSKGSVNTCTERPTPASEPEPRRRPNP